MRDAVFSFQPRLAGNPELSREELTADVLARRARQRRQMLVFVAASYLIDAFVLLLYALAGTTPLIVAPAYAASGLILVAVFLMLSESHVNDRFRDHYFVMPQAMASVVMLLGFLAFAPEVGCVFLCTLFMVFSFSSLRASAVQTAATWTAMVGGLAVLFLTTDLPIAMPNGNYLERFATMLTFCLTIGRCMFVGVFSSSLRETLYRRGLELKEAYKRIEQLAEIDELTGCFNRRSIMRMLDDEISRAARTGSPCSVALIDLDWFKKINDEFGHPTGDEVLRTFAIAVFANIRGIDKFGRYGGEEFLLVMPDSDEAAAQRAVDRLRRIVADLDWSAISAGMRATISAGVVTLRPGEASDAILCRADTALYRAKAMGRNRVVPA